MSERGSFVTEYIYCPSCLAAAERVLLSNTKYLCSQKVRSWQEGPALPIIAGKVGGSYQGAELDTFEEVASELKADLCHPLRIAVLADCGEGKVFELVPARDQETDCEDSARGRR